VYSVLCVCVSGVCGGVAVMQRSSYSAIIHLARLQPAPVDSEPSGRWLRRQRDRSWHWPTEPHSTHGVAEDEERGGREQGSMEGEKREAW